MGSYKLFDIIGPRMIGPSSSHTAGAARLGNVASRILGNQVRTAEITLYGSFAQTGKGHGTDKAIIAGLLGFAPDDLRIRNARFADDARPIEEGCACHTCANGFSRAYLRHLDRCGEILGCQLATIHNLHHYLTLMAEIRAAIAAGGFARYATARAAEAAGDEAMPDLR